MARSTYIYLVYNNGEMLPMAAFTVKWEALQYIEQTFSSKENIKLYAGADGRNAGWTLIDLSKQKPD